MARILVAMSGGVDSSLVAALLVEQGHEVCGATMNLHLHLSPNPDDTTTEPNNSDSDNDSSNNDAVTRARRVCEWLNIPHHTVNIAPEFRHHVVNYFVQEYAQGATPNPCIACNRAIKFGVLWEHARALGYENLATGHYARIVSPPPPADTRCPVPPPTGYALLRGVDRPKDQSYVLSMLQQPQLAHVFLPLGAMTKQDVRTLARARGLEAADTPESQDICFIPDNDYRRFLREQSPDSFVPGPILDQEGHEIGQHQGLPAYTIGQRKGLGIASTQRLFVTTLDPARNAVVVGPAEATLHDRLVIEQVRFVAGGWAAEPFPCLVQLRAHATPAEATATPMDDGDGQRVELLLHTPQRAATPGQTAVLYSDDMVLGGGRILATL